MEHMRDDEIRALRDSIARADTEVSASVWERYRGLRERIEELKARCEEAAHSFTIVLVGKSGTRRHLVRDGWNERRTCIMCGTEEVGALATGFARRFLTRKVAWRFEKLTRQSARSFTDPEWYFETCSIIRNFSFPTGVILQHAFPRRPASRGGRRNDLMIQLSGDGSGIEPENGIPGYFEWLANK